MSVEIRVPTLGESVTEATVAKWLKKVGDAVSKDEPVVELETDKVSLEVSAAEAGVLSEIAASEGANVEVGALLGAIVAGAQAAAEKIKSGRDESAGAPAPEARADNATAEPLLSPAVRRLVDEHGVDPAQIAGSGKGGRLVKADVLAAIAGAPATQPSAPVQGSAPAQPVAAKTGPAAPATADGPREERVPMTRLRRRIAERLKEAQNTAAMLTTFNEVDMSAVVALREAYREAFETRHGVRLGFMSFFVKAAIAALREIPAVNAEIDGSDIVYKNHYDIGVAVSAPQGLVVPVVRDADRLSFAAIEKAINAYGKKAREGRLAVEDLTGGTFTISNGGIFGSLMSTPILNPPQSGILGMHKIQKRPVAVGDEVVVRPMMYLALSYDHRIVDGREAVTFLVRIKDSIEDPRRLILDL